MDEDICVACFWENEVISHNINGRCDTCGGTDWDSKKVLTGLADLLAKGFTIEGVHA